MILHSYVLAKVSLGVLIIVNCIKILVKLKDHKSGAQMLIRVAKNISRFPSRKLIEKFNA